MEMLKELRNEARQRGNISAAIQAEVKRGETRRFYVKQVEVGDAHEFENKTEAELREFIAEQDAMLALAAVGNGRVGGHVGGRKRYPRSDAMRRTRQPLGG